MSVDPDEERLAGATGGTLPLLTHRPPATSGRRAPDGGRRIAVRSRGRWSAGAGLVIVAAVLAALSLTGGGRHATRAPVPGGPVPSGDRIDGAVQLIGHSAPSRTADASAVDAVAAAEQRLSIALLRELGDGADVSVSPASLYLALGMLQNAAHGETARQISHALQAAGISTDRQNAGLAGLAAELQAAAAKDAITLDSANSLWQQRGFEVRPSFLDALSTYYGTGLWQVDFAGHTRDALTAIDAWTSEKTHGKITKLFDQLDPQTVLVIANAIYFHAAWQTPFLKSESEPGPFSTDAGQVTVPFMTGGRGLTAAVTDRYQAVQLPYSGGRLAALAVMPTSASLDDFVNSLTPDEISAIASSVRPGLSVSLPRFGATATIDLKPVLQALGMQRAFRADADLSGLSDQPTNVDQVIQRVYVGVGEKGTTAAAATGVGITAMSATLGPDVQLDHPFLFLVRDTKTGAILFASEVMDPAAG